MENSATRSGDTSSPSLDSTKNHVKLFSFYELNYHFELNSCFYLFIIIIYNNYCCCCCYCIYLFQTKRKTQKRGLINDAMSAKT